MSKYPDNLYEIHHVNGCDFDKTIEALRQMGIETTEEGVRSAYYRSKPGRSNKPVKPLAAGSIVAPDETRPQLFGQKFIFTAAQNNTDIHKGFWNALLAYSNHNGAEIIVSTFTYNKNEFQNLTKDDADLWYDPEIRDYIRNESLQVSPDLVFCGELNILPTAGNPLSGFDNYCRAASGIIPHAKVAMKSLPGLPEQGARFLYTTGCVTQRNYIQKKAGQKAEFHHVFGALVVEIDDLGQFHARQLIADASGSFYDLNTQYTASGDVKEGIRVEAVNWGDIHVEKQDDLVSQVSFGIGGILDTLRPKYQLIHDLSDFSARNHHNIKDPHFLAEMYYNSTDSVEAGLHKAAAFLEDISLGRNVETIVVESNHDLAYRRWLKTADTRYDPVNIRFFHESNAEVYRRIEAGEVNFNVFEWALRKKKVLKNVKFLQENQSFIICPDSGGIECGLHGHTGPNGARGNPNNLRTIGRKVNTGHTHSAGIVDGVYTAGVTAKLDMGYNKGPSSWSHSHIITYPNGKRAIITIKNGEWKA